MWYDVLWVMRCDMVCLCDVVVWHGNVMRYGVVAWCDVIWGGVVVLRCGVV